MALIACPKCNSEDITGTKQPDSQLLIHCADCGHEWLRGEARRDPGRPAVQTIDSLHAAFPTAAAVRPDVRERVELLKADFQLDHPEPDPEVADFRAFAKMLKKGVRRQVIRRGEKDFEKHGTRAQENTLEDSRRVMEEIQRRKGLV